MTIAQQLRDQWHHEEIEWSPWFRGQRDFGWRLRPKFFRTNNNVRVPKHIVESEMREEFIKRAPILCEMLPAGNERRAEWEWYFMMQHFGAATRLLDWSDGSLIALYFAVREGPTEKNADAVVWAICPWDLNQQTIDKAWVIPPSATGTPENEYVTHVQRWLPERFSEWEEFPPEVVAIEPTHVAKRMSAQNSCFTIHGSQDSWLEDQHSAKKHWIAKIKIPAARINSIRRELREAGVNESTIFPGLEGLCQSINDRWGGFSYNK